MPDVRRDAPPGPDSTLAGEARAEGSLGGGPTGRCGVFLSRVDPGVDSFDAGRNDMPDLALRKNCTEVEDPAAAFARASADTFESRELRRSASLTGVSRGSSLSLVAAGT